MAETSAATTYKAAPERILIVLMGSLGDVVRGLAVVTSLKRGFPGVHITWLVEPKCENLVRLHKGIDRVIVFERTRGLRALPALVRELRRDPFDTVLDMQRHFKSGLFSWLSGSPRRIGFNRHDAKEFNWLFNNIQIAKPPSEISKLDHYLLFLQALGLKSDTRLDFGLSDEKEKFDNREMLQALPTKYCILVMGSSWSTKDWAPAGYQKLSRLLLSETKQGIVFVGDGSQRESAEKIVQSASDSRLVNLVGRTTIGQLVALIDSAEYCVGPDSGPGHIAGAVDTPYISLFGPTSPERTSPRGSEALVIRAELGCMPCYRRSCPGLDTLCMRLISPEAIMEKVRILEARPRS